MRQRRSHSRAVADGTLAETSFHHHDALGLGTSGRAVSKGNDVMKRPLRPKAKPAASRARASDEMSVEPISARADSAYGGRLARGMRAGRWVFATGQRHRLRERDGRGGGSGRPAPERRTAAQARGTAHLQNVGEVLAEVGAGTLRTWCASTSTTLASTRASLSRGAARDLRQADPPLDLDPASDASRAPAKPWRSRSWPRYLARGVAISHETFKPSYHIHQSRATARRSALATFDSFRGRPAKRATRRGSDRSGGASSSGGCGGTGRSSSRPSSSSPASSRRPWRRRGRASIRS